MHQEWIEQNEHKRARILFNETCSHKDTAGIVFLSDDIWLLVSFLLVPSPIVTVSYQRDTTTTCCSFLWSSFLIEQGGTHTHASVMNERMQLVSSSFFNLPFLKKAFSVRSLGCPFFCERHSSSEGHNAEENLFRSVSRWCEDDMKEISMTLLKIIQTRTKPYTERCAAFFHSVFFSPFEQNRPLN